MKLSQSGRQRAGSIAVLHAGHSHQHEQQEPERVGRHVALAAVHPLSGVSQPRSRPAVTSSQRLSRVEHGGDGFDLNKLVVVAEHGDAYQGAGNVVVTKRVPDYLPGSHQVLLPR
jgi:hypothetical protein